MGDVEKQRTCFGSWPIALGLVQVKAEEYNGIK